MRREDRAIENRQEESLRNGGNGIGDVGFRVRVESWFLWFYRSKRSSEKREREKLATIFCGFGGVAIIRRYRRRRREQDGGVRFRRHLRRWYPVVL